jgi:MYXO-CTERM domain-containing protein
VVEHHNSWGWLGLLGLAGLASLLRRPRPEIAEPVVGNPVGYSNTGSNPVGYSNTGSTTGSVRNSMTENPLNEDGIEIVDRRDRPGR